MADHDAFNSLAREVAASKRDRDHAMRDIVAQGDLSVSKASKQYRKFWYC